MQNQNLTSALAYAALTTPSGSDEKLLYESIVEIPQYQSAKASFLLDKEDEEMVVEDSFDGFKQMYQPILKENFQDVMEIKDGKFLIDRKDPATQRLLLTSINDNIYKNLDGFSV